MPELIDELKLAILEALDLSHIDPADVGADTSFFQGGLELDSVDILELVVVIDQRYGVKIYDRELGKQVLRTVGTLAEHIAANRPAAPAA
jgi:acyl carrier protein